MAEPFEPLKVKLFSGFIFSDNNILENAIFQFTGKYGIVDFSSEKIPFNHTDYYAAAGNNLFKKLISFETLIKREEMPNIKLFTNNIEKNLSVNDNRIINIDPGYMTMSNVFLASCKDYYHRIYIADGVYMENELRFTNKDYIPFEWTYPDFKKEEYLQFFKSTRKIYSKQLER